MSCTSRSAKYVTLGRIPEMWPKEANLAEAGAR